MGSCSSVLQPVCCGSSRRLREPEQVESNTVRVCPICDKMIDAIHPGMYPMHITNCISSHQHRKSQKTPVDKQSPYNSKYNWFKEKL